MANLNDAVALLNGKAGTTVVATKDIAALRDGVVSKGGPSTNLLQDLWAWIYAWTGPVNPGVDMGGPGGDSGGAGDF